MKLGFFWISIKKELNYRWHIVFSIMSIVLATIAIIFLWKYIYRSDKEMMEYMTLYAIISNLISLIYSNRCADCIADKVYKGTFAVDLLRPISFLKLNFLEVTGEITANVFIKGIPIAIILFCMNWKMIKQIQITSFILGMIAVILAFMFYMMLYTLLGFLSFRFYEIWPFNRLMNDTIRFFSGAFIPLSLFPKWLKDITDMLPFRYLYSFPIEIILSKKENISFVNGFLSLIIWNTIMIGLVYFVYKRALYKCVVQGG